MKFAITGEIFPCFSALQYGGENPPIFQRSGVIDVELTPQLLDDMMADHGDFGFNGIRFRILWHGINRGINELGLCGYIPTNDHDLLRSLIKNGWEFMHENAARYHNLFSKRLIAELKGAK